MRIASLILLSLIVFSVNLQADQLAKLAPGSLVSGDNYASAISVSGDYIFIGAYGDNYKATDAGVVYIFERGGNNWADPAIKLYSPAPAAYEKFGYSVGVSGSYAIVGAPATGTSTGEAYLFKRESGSWNEMLPRWSLPLYSANGDRIGESVAIDGAFAVIGAENAKGNGRAYVVARVDVGGEHWVLNDTLIASDGAFGDDFGCSVAISGHYIVVGASSHMSPGSIRGAAYVYRFNTGTGFWDQQAKLINPNGDSNDMFGTSVSIAPGYVAVGTLGEPNGTDSVYVFQGSGSSWTRQALSSSDGEFLGESVSISGNYLLAGAPGDDDQGTDSGSKYMFAWDGGRWVEFKSRAEDGAAGTNLGRTVSIDNLISVVGAEMAAYVYEEPFDDRYFAYTADIHVYDLGGGTIDRWNKLLQGALDRPIPPEFMLVAGDLVSWGQGVTGITNFMAFMGSDHLNTTVDPYLVGDSEHQFPIYMCPGNHDYRKFWQFFPPYSLENYRNYVHGATYYLARLNQYAIFSLDTGWDVPKDSRIFYWPEGGGISNTDINFFKNDLDNLDGWAQGADTSSVRKIVVMHHPVRNPTGRGGRGNGAFIKNVPGFQQACRDYGVDQVVSGHLHPSKPIISDLDANSWNEGETRCVHSPDGERGTLGWESLSPAPVPGQQGGHENLWGDISVRIVGNVEAWGENQYGHRVGRDENGDPQIDIPGSLYDRDHIRVANENMFYDVAVTEISIYKDPGQHLWFIAEALETGEMDVEITERYEDGSYKVYTYEDIPMFYGGGGAASACSMLAPRSEFTYLWYLEHPDSAVRGILPLMEWAARDHDLFQDTFPENMTSQGTGRVDAAVDRAHPDSAYIQPGDSAVVMCRDPLGGLFNPDPFSEYGTAVYCYFSIRPPDQPGKMTPLELEEDNFRWPLVDSVTCNGQTWYQFRCDTVFESIDPLYPRTEPVEDMWCVDINDHVITNGDTLLFFFAAVGSTHVTYWSHERGPTLFMDEACLEPMEMQVLPDRGSQEEGEILFVCNDEDPLVRRYYDTAFELMGIDHLVDRYDKRGGSAMVGNGLGDRCTNVYDQLVSNYRIIIWNAGDLDEGTICDGTRGKSESLQMLFNFLEMHHDQAGLYLSGRSIAEELAALDTGPGSPAETFVSKYIPHDLFAGDHVDIHGRHPLAIAEQPGSFFSLIDSVVAYAGVAYAGSTATHNFDQIRPLSGSSLEMTYGGTGDPDDGAVIAKTTNNTSEQPVKVVLSGFGVHHIRNDYPADVPYRTYFLTDILNHFGNGDANPTAAGRTSLYRNSLAQNYPNPFNPVTTIHYSIRERAPVSLKIYNVAGQLVKTLVSKTQKPRLEGYTVRWDGTSNAGQPVSSGVYFYRLVTNNFTQARKLVLLR